MTFKGAERIDCSVSHVMVWRFALKKLRPMGKQGHFLPLQTFRLKSTPIGLTKGNPMQKEYTKDSWPTDRWRNFTYAEMRCKESFICKMDDEFMDKLQTLRENVGFPLYITSAYRDVTHSIEAKKIEEGKSKGGTHTLGCAVDIKIQGAQAVVLLKKALEIGFTGFGISQTGKNRFIHLDSAESKENAPRPHVWSY